MRKVDLLIENERNNYRRTEQTGSTNGKINIRSMKKIIKKDRISKDPARDNIKIELIKYEGED